MKTFRAYLQEQTMVAKSVDTVIAEAEAKVNLSMEEIKSRITASLGIQNFKMKSNVWTVVLADKNRVGVLEAIEKLFAEEGAKYDPSKGSSSIGAVSIGRFTVGVAPANLQGKKSAGLDNEDSFIDNINDIIGTTPTNIIIKGGRRTFKVNNVIKAIEVGRDTAGRKKSDVNLQLKDKTLVPISIKKDNAEMWESADVLWGAQAKKVIDKQVKLGKAKLKDIGSGIKSIVPNLAVKATTRETKDVVFGSDILAKNGAVIYRTFKSSDFKYNVESGVLEITVTDILTSVAQVENSQSYAVHWLIRNNKSRNNPRLYRGIRVLAVGKKRINKNVLVVNR
tara:strand:+ start:158 stop:1168 length:1011 start_codon:yes stop_codon:yes gene_type:complete